MTQLAAPASGASSRRRAQAVYAFNTDSAQALAMVNQLLGQGAIVARGASAFDSGGVHFVTGAALVDGDLGAACDDRRGRGQVADAGLRPRLRIPCRRYALTLPKIGVYTGATTAPTNPAFHGTGDGQCTQHGVLRGDVRPDGARGHPDLADRPDHVDRPRRTGVLVSQGYTAFINPLVDDQRRRRTRPRWQAFVNAGGRYIGSRAGGLASARNAGITTVNTNTISGIRRPARRSTPRGATSNPVAWGFDAGGWIYREAEQRPELRPGDARRATAARSPPPRRCPRTGPRATAAVPAGLGQLLRLRRQRQRDAARPAGRDRPAVRSRSRVLLGFDAWYRAWTTQDGAGRPERGALPVTARRSRRPDESARGVPVLAAGAPRQPGIVRTTLPSCSPDSRRSCAARVSLSGKTESITGFARPETTRSRAASKSARVPIVEP